MFVDFFAEIFLNFHVLFLLEVMDRSEISSFIDSWRHSTTLQWDPMGP